MHSVLPSLTSDPTKQIPHSHYSIPIIYISYWSYTPSSLIQTCLIRARLLTGHHLILCSDPYRDHYSAGKLVDDLYRFCNSRRLVYGQRHGLRMATAAVSKKRKRTVLTLEKKIEIIKALEKGSSQRVVGERVEVAKSTIADIWKDRKKIIDALGSTESPSFVYKKRCVIRQAKFE